MKAKEDVIINGRSLKDILDLHELFLTTGGKEGERADLEGANLEDVNLEDACLQDAYLIGVSLKYANLTDANLIGANLASANLEDADLIGACLEGASLRYANLKCACLYNACLKDANLEGANLEGANLEGAYLKCAYLVGANLKCAYLVGANLKCAYLVGACLKDANLEGANLEGVNLKGAYLFRANLVGVNLESVIYNHTTLFYALQCPEKGNFIAYKKAGKCIVELEILESSKRSSATTRKCRCDKARVISIENIETGEKVMEVSSNRDKDFIYKVGEVVSVDNFNEDRWVECTTGIHFFMTKHEAESYDE